MSRGRERERETPHAETHIFSIRRTRKSASTIATQCMRCWRPLNRFKFARVCRRNSQIELFFFFSMAVHGTADKPLNDNGKPHIFEPLYFVIADIYSATRMNRKLDISILFALTSLFVGLPEPQNGTRN